MYHKMTVPMRAQQALGIAATVTAACLSILSGWQRGGFLAERVLLICVGVVLVVAAHLLPALCRPHGWRIQAVGAFLWIGCMGATCYGHAGFFVMAQKHAGEVRAAVIPVVSVPGRNLAEIASDRASVVARLARVTERKCGDRCATVRIERTSLNAQLVALDAESAEVTRHELAFDRADAERATAKTDPLAGLLTGFGVATGRLDLVTGIVFAVVIEGVACFCWLLVLGPIKTTASTITPAKAMSHRFPVTRVTAASAVVAATDGQMTGPVDGINSAAVDKRTDDLSRVLSAIRDGALRGTVTEIRKYLGCSQARAATLRKQLAEQMQSRHATTKE